MAAPLTVSFDFRAAVTISGAQRNRPKIGAERRLAIYARDGYRCVDCGSAEGITLDHKVPLSKGGGSETANLQTLCTPCNQRKADATSNGGPGDVQRVNRPGAMATRRHLSS